MTTTPAQFGQFYTAYLASPEWMALPTRAAKVYGVLVAHANSKTRSWVLKVKYLLKVVGSSRSTLFRALKDLEAAGLVERVHRFAESGRQLANNYRLLPPLSMRGAGEFQALEFSLEGEGVTADTPGGVTADTPITEIQFTKKSPPAPRCPGGVTDDLQDPEIQEAEPPEVLDLVEPDPEPAPAASKAEQLQHRQAELAQLREVVAEDLAQLAEVHGPEIYRSASEAAPGVLARLRSRARAQGLSGRLRDLRKALRDVVQDLPPGSTRSTPSTWSKPLAWDALTAAQKAQLEEAMEAAGYMTPEAQALYASEEGWTLFKRRQAQLAQQLGMTPEA